MTFTFNLGRYVVAAAMLAFGVLYVVYGRTGGGLGPPWTPLGSGQALVVGGAFAVAALAWAARVEWTLAALPPAAVCLVRALVVDVPKIVATPRAPDPWTSGFELVGIGAACLMLARAGRVCDVAGRVLFALAMVVFGVQHLMYGPFVAVLISAWIPGKLFWAYLTGVAFLAAALAIGVNRMAALAANLLGVMFLLWVAVLHAPRVAHAPHNRDEWTSLLVALAMGGGSLVVAGRMQEEPWA